MKRVVRRKRLVLKQWVQEWLAAHLFVGMVYISFFAWLFDSRRLGCNLCIWFNGCNGCARNYL